jgi:glycerate dehydrogenase
VDLDAAARRGIAVCNIRRYATPSVVQHVFALLLSLTRHLSDYQRAVQSGAWQRSGQFCLLDYPIRELGGLTLGIVGYGELGQAVAATAEQAFGMRVLIAQRPGGSAEPGRLPLQQLLPQVDVLSLHCPLTPETRGLIGAEELALMKPDALLINTARGGIINEGALAAALLTGRLGGAGIDVLATEPPGSDSPLLQQPIPNLIVTPHIAWASRQSPVTPATAGSTGTEYRGLYGRQAAKPCHRKLKEAHVTDRPPCPALHRPRLPPLPRRKACAGEPATRGGDRRTAGDQHHRTARAGGRTGDP